MKDVNNTRYHLVLGEADWNQSRTDNSLLADSQSSNKPWDYEQQRQGIHLLADVFTFRQVGSQAQSLEPVNRQDSDIDTYGHRYWIDDAGTQIRVRWAEAEKAETLFPFPEATCPPTTPSVFAPAEPSTPSTSETLSGLAVLNDGYLVVGSPKTDSLLAFDLYSLDGGPLRISLPEIASGQTTNPFDLAACADGGLLILDRESKQVWQLDHRLAVRTSSGHSSSDAISESMLFQPRLGEVRNQKGPLVAEPVVLEMEGMPVAISPHPNGGFWLLENDTNNTASTLWYYPPGATAPDEATELLLRTENLIAQDEQALDLEQIVGYDLAYVPDDRSEKSAFDGTLFIVDIEGNQAYALRVTALSPLSIRIEKCYYPLRSLSLVSIVAGRFDTASTQSAVSYLQTSDRWLPIKPLPRQRYKPEAALILKSFDGHEPGCLWHRLCLDACLPPGTALKIEARAAEQEAALSKASWQLQPTPYRRPSVEVPYSALWDEAELKDKYVGTWELLFQQVKGQYMQIRLTLMGNRRSSPLVRSLRAHYPRFSYLQSYLPDVYQQDPASSSFLDRFLANPEGIFTTVEGLVAQVQTHFDARTVPPEAVTWLASWIGLALEDHWSDYQRRLLIAQAPYFFQRRGTQVGLLQAILLALYPELGPCIFQDNAATLCFTVRIVERFLTRTQSSVAAGDPTELNNTNANNTNTDSRAHRFTVLIPTTLDDTTQRLIERIVELEKPAHTAFTVKQYWAMFRVGEVRLGIDTVLGKGGQFETFELGRSALAEAALAETFPYNLTNRTVIRKI